VQFPVAPLQTTAKYEQIKMLPFWKLQAYSVLKIYIITNVMVLGNWRRNFWLKPGRNIALNFLNWLKETGNCTWELTRQSGHTT